MMTTSSVTNDAAQAWLDASVRQHIVELALVGAQHGLETEARTILRALPLLVPQVQARQCLHAALLIALGDTAQARVCLARLTAEGEAHEAHEADVSAASVLQHWLDATASSSAPSPPSPPSSLATSPEVLPQP
ncbi:DUF1039 domain-containing protein [Pandoraea sputorum]|uniref:DUF1039 domain-containing protein n=1 Tax=Pandoraea sputorum TaxID=93222 RepID=UPI001E4ABD1A|nr:DUF1039 domain-containing protein [Pandoraea sputorum]MCE4062437.1 DUF1039 domain-containing protein [Pandoraea sputorum]